MKRFISFFGTRWGIAAELVAVAGVVLYFITWLPNVTVVDAKVVGPNVELTVRNAGQSTAYGAVLRDVSIYVGDQPVMGALPVKLDEPIDLAPGQEVVYREKSSADGEEIFANVTLEYRNWLGWPKTKKNRIRIDTKPALARLQ